MSASNDLVHLQERLLHLEDQLEQLSDVVAKQAQALEILLQAERDRHEASHPIGPHNDPPPHY